ncbi:L-histidine N(alpha)-methyltransferase [Aulosira sp. FACHB-615]|uniref:L-histidine N(alpha)-methyltransferase n=1 Tax=Aulosira sp. FACHB-615 TaxID=2692777 RepID=UPI0016883718|nr:L-histidine N(alpha)-methyltransferase [Aulosira sp. FACHB-615]MBD2488560.1 L-histidine N(alpha)-methyltransferase [Aulosira sp. FACHB-615]
MAKNFHQNSQFSADNSISHPRIAKPSSEFYTVFSSAEVLEIIHALETRWEIPLKYSYKGQGAKIWHDFYQKFISPKWYRKSSVEIDLLRNSFAYIYENISKFSQVNIIDVGAGNSYPAKEFVFRLNQLNKINKYIALDISEGLLTVSKKNFTSWFPKLDYSNQQIDIENSCIPANFSGKPKIILHLGVTMGNHHNRNQVLHNFRNSMDENDLLIFTNEIGSNSQWDGIARGGCKYHAEAIYRTIKNTIGIKSQDCQLIRKYDLATDSVVANIKFQHNYTIDFSFQGIDKSIEIPKGKEITIWRHHKYEMPKLTQELESAGLELVHYTTNKYSSHIMAICQVANI